MLVFQTNAPNPTDDLQLNQSSKPLREILENLENFSEIDILVAFFYFSGFLTVHPHFKDLKVRILVGLDLDFIANKLVMYLKKDQIYNEEEAIENLVKQLRIIFEKDKRLDTQKAAQALEIFIQKIKNGTLEVRKTQNPNHAKLYILTRKSSRDNPMETNIVITGSSNFTFQGLEGQDEVNVILYDPRDYQSAKSYFDRLWDKSIPILNKENIQRWEPKLRKSLWPLAEYSPYELYLKVIYEFFKLKPTEGSIKTPSDISRRFKSFEYQKDAILAGLDKLEKYNGVLLADVVGLGKSIIASSIAHNWVLSHPRTSVIVIAPPGLKPQWEKYTTLFRLPAKIFSSSPQGIQQALQHYSNNNDPKLIIVDEAHTFRNENTQGYQALHQLTLGNKVILLTATPYNNRPGEILNLIKLFQVPRYTSLPVQYESLQQELNELDREYQRARKNKPETRDKIVHKIRSKLLRIISPVLIRRTREDLKRIKKYKEDLKRRGISFPKIKGPKELTYTLTPQLLKKYLATLESLVGSMSKPQSVKWYEFLANADELTKNEYKGFKGARYRPLDYLKVKSLQKYKEDIKDFYNVGKVDIAKYIQQQLALIIRNILVHRFESSIFAFYNTLKNQIRAHEATIKVIKKKGFLPLGERGRIRVEDLERLLETPDNDLPAEDALSEEQGRIKIKIWKQDLTEQFFKDLYHDYNLLRSIKELWFPEEEEYSMTELAKFDPKIKGLANKIKSLLTTNPEKKIVIFTQYRDTANYIAEYLKHHIRPWKALKFTGDERASSRSHIEEVMRNFDASYPEQEDKYQILVATDVLSEGVNLHRAGRIINYDIPYNPSRVVQRVGRVNRIDKKTFASIEIYNYFPTATGEDITNIKAVTTLKQTLATLLFGSDTAILTPQEKDLIEKFYNERYANEKTWNELMDTYSNKVRQLLKEEPSWDVKYRAIYESLTQRDKAELENMPLKLKIRRKVKDSAEHVNMIMFAKKGNVPVFYVDRGNGNIELISPEVGLKYFEAKRSEKGYKFNDQAWTTYKLIKNFIEQRRTTRESRTGRGVRERISVLLDSFKQKATDEHLIKHLNLIRDAIFKWEVIPRYNLKELDKVLRQFAQEYEKALENHLPENLQATLSKLLEQIVPISYLKRIRQHIEKLESAEKIILIAEQFSDE